jgi:thimet oligopeptidase
MTLPMSSFFSTLQSSIRDRTTIPLPDACALKAMAGEAIDRSRQRLAGIESLALTEVTPANVLDAWDAASIVLEDAFGPISLLNSVHPDSAVRDASDDALIQESSFLTDVFQNERLYERVHRVVPETPPQRQLQKDLLESFEDSGVSLPPDRRARFKAISDRLTELSQQFARNVRENPMRVTFTPEECAGLPPAFLDRAPRDAAGRIVLGFDYPDYNPFMMNATHAEARKRYYVANMNRGTEENIVILDEITALRKEIADLYGMASFAEYVTRRAMVENPATVTRFLDEVKKAVDEAEVRDIAELEEMKARLLGVPPEEAHIERWDVSYYRERLREERFAIDQETLRRYFPTPATIDWMLDMTSRLYAIRFERVDVPVWHEDVGYLDVIDAATGHLIGGIYLDLYPRDGKYKHAAAWPVRGGSRRGGRKPISTFVTNFDRTGLTHGELETLLHEFGHVLHGVLSATIYNQHSGTSVERDFVEAPSQMFEEWGCRLESLRLIPEHCPDCPVVDEALVVRLNAARHFGSGIDYGRQLLYASYDMALCGENPGDSMSLWRQMEASTPLGYVEGTAFPGTFEHIAAGYAAGYYGYMWAKAIALDLLSAFGDNLMNPEIGQRFRETILARGSEEPARTIVERFLARPVSTDAFFREIRGE